MQEIREALSARNGGTEPPPSPRDAPSQQTNDETQEPIEPLLARGLLIFGVSVSVSLLIALVLPTLGKFVALILPVLIGFAAAFRWGSIALIIAGFFAMAAGIGSQLAFERHTELASGTAVTLGSIAEAPRHLEATRFIVTDVCPARTFSSNMQRTIVRQFGAGPREERWTLQIMPLVPTGWTRDRPVPAWIACTTTPGFDCLRRIDDDVSRTVCVRDYDVGFFRTAIANAERRHGLTSAAAAPVLETSGDPIGAPEVYLAGTAVVPLAVFGLWAVALMGWRVWRAWRGRKRTPA